jgi:2-phosphosulfolactate phosphatase
MSQSNLNVYRLPQHVAAEELAGGTVVVIDLLRASTTICQALASGATDVVPFLEVADALAAAAAANDRAGIVLGGERSGLRIDAFDLGNSPAEYTVAAVHARRVFLTTTNGTRALDHARLADRIVVGAIVNLSAVAASLRDAKRVEIVCAGTAGRESRDDLLAAGALVDALATTATGKWNMNAPAEAARFEWRALAAAAKAGKRPPSEQLAMELRNTPGGRNLVDIGMDDDLVACAAIDALSVVPVLDVAAWRITLP